jgi:Rrf2 family nitric oxide-sensitive transcriptional repressor
VLTDNCKLRGALAAGMRAFYDSLDQYTLARITDGATGEQIVRMHQRFVDTGALARPLAP